MGGFKKFLWSLMTIVLIVISAILASLALVDESARHELLSYLDNQTYRYVLLGVAIVVLVFAIILLIDIIANQNDKREYLVEDNTKVKIVKGRTVEANIKCNVYGDRDFEDLGRKIQAEVERGLKELTGLESSNAHVQLNKASKNEERELR